MGYVDLLGKCIVCGYPDMMSHEWYMDRAKPHPYLRDNLEYLEWVVSQKELVAGK